VFDKCIFGGEKSAYSIILLPIGRQNAPNQYAIDQGLVNRLLASASSPRGLTVADVAKYRKGREAVEGPLDATHEGFAHNETGLLLGVFGVGDGNDPTSVGRLSISNETVG
jgi:hypothetical protein